MTDPTDPLAHLYADLVPDDDELLEPPVVETSLDELIAAAPEPEELSESDLDELALLVRARLAEQGAITDEEAAALGLGEIIESGEVFGPGVPIPDRELVLNDVGRAVLKRVIDAENAARFENELRALGVDL